MNPQVLSVLNLQGLSHSLDWSVGGGTLDWQWLSTYRTPAPSMLLTPYWWSIIPEADLKSTTPTALSLLDFTKTHWLLSLTMLCTKRFCIHLCLIFFPTLTNCIIKKDNVPNPIFLHCVKIILSKGEFPNLQLQEKLCDTFWTTVFSRP